LYPLVVNLVFEARSQACGDLNFVCARHVSSKVPPGSLEDADSNCKEQELWQGQYQPETRVHVTIT
jgi:hypothetical protein